MSATGALISPELAARVHVTLGAAWQSSEPDEIAQLGLGLIEAIQAELEKKYGFGLSKRSAITSQPSFTHHPAGVSSQPGNGYGEGGSVV